MIFGWGGKSGPNRDAHGPVISPTIDEVVRESPCDIAVVKQRGARDIRRILVPVRGGPHAELALRFADALAHRFDATVCVMHVVPAGVTEAVRAQAEHALAERGPVEEDVAVGDDVLAVEPGEPRHIGMGAGGDDHDEGDRNQVLGPGDPGLA